MKWSHAYKEIANQTIFSLNISEITQKNKDRVKMHYSTENGLVTTVHKHDYSVADELYNQLQTSYGLLYGQIPQSYVDSFE